MQSTSVSDQLMQIAAKPRQRFASVKPVSQVVLELADQDPQTAFRLVQREILKWLKNRAGRPLPDEAWQGESFELQEVGAQRVAAVALNEPQYWAARLDDADKNVPQRTWTTEIGIGRHPNDGLVFGCRLVCVSRGDEPPFEPSVPGFVRTIVGACGAYLDGRLLALQPWLVSTEDEVDDLAELLTAPKRQSDVYVFSLPEGSENMDDAAASAANVHNHTLGAAHIAVLTGPASFHLTDRVAKEFSVFRQAVRTYRSGFDPELDDPFRHPLAMSQTVAAWEGLGPKAFEAFLIRQALQRSVSAADIERRVPPFTTVRRIFAERSMDRARSAGASEAELLCLLDEQQTMYNGLLDEQKTIYNGLLEDADRERDAAQRAEQEARATQHRLRARLRYVEEQLLNRTGNAADVEIPETLDNLKDWAERHLSGYVLLHSRALTGAKKSIFKDPSLIYKSLLLLRDHYVPMRRSGGLELKRAYEENLQAMGLEESSTFAGDRWGEQGDEYRVQHGRARRLLDRHLKNGNARDPRRCFRLYFFWDESDEQVVVGWLPSHLATSIT